MKENKITVKNMITGNQSLVNIDELLEIVK